jgi:hypothetical protein
VAVVPVLPLEPVLLVEDVEPVLPVEDAVLLDPVDAP